MARPPSGMSTRRQPYIGRPSSSWMSQQSSCTRSSHRLRTAAVSWRAKGHTYTVVCVCVYVCVCVCVCVTYFLLYFHATNPIPTSSVFLLPSVPSYTPTLRSPLLYADSRCPSFPIFNRLLVSSVPFFPPRFSHARALAVTSTLH